MLASDSQSPGFSAGFAQGFGAAAPLRRVATESELLSILGAPVAATHNPRTVHEVLRAHHF